MVGAQVLVQNFRLPESVSCSQAILPGECSGLEDSGLTLSQLTMREQVFEASPVLAISLPLSVSVAACSLPDQQDGGGRGLVGSQCPLPEPHTHHQFIFARWG